MRRMEFWDGVRQTLVPTWPEALAVFIASGVMYLTFTTVLRVWGQRLFANRSGSGWRWHWCWVPSWAGQCWDRTPRWSAG